VLESLAALEAIEARELDGDPPRPPCLDVLDATHCRHRLCPADRPRGLLRREVRSAQPYRDLRSQDFGPTTFDFVATGGYGAGGLRALAPV